MDFCDFLSSKADLNEQIVVVVILLWWKEKKLFGFFSCIHALMIQICYVNSITVLLNICGRYIITVEKLDFLGTLYIS